MKLEDYVAGVVAGEMENYWPVEALAAQAILLGHVLEFITDKAARNLEMRIFLLILKRPKPGTHKKSTIGLKGCEIDPR